MQFNLEVANMPSPPFPSLSSLPPSTSNLQALRALKTKNPSYRLINCTRSQTYTLKGVSNSNSEAIVNNLYLVVPSLINTRAAQWQGRTA